MTKFYHHPHTILGSQTTIEGAPADYSKTLFSGNKWSYSGSTFGLTVRSDDEASDKFHGGYKLDFYNPIHAVGSSFEQSVNIDGSAYSASYDYNFEVYNEATNLKYYIAVIDIDLNTDLEFRSHGGSGEAQLESGYYLIFVGDVPPPDTELTVFSYAAPKKTHFDMGAQLVCFLEGTLVETAEGSIPVQDMRIGTMVRTMDHGMQPLRWIGARHILPGKLRDHQRPIRISAGALAPGVPDHDLYVSPQHRLLIISKLAERMFGEKEVLIAAKHLIDLQGIEVVANTNSASYWHLLFEHHQIVRAHGTLSESLYPGSQAMKAFSDLARAELLANLPHLMVNDVEATYPPARLMVSGSRARQFIRRSLKNSKPVFHIDRVSEFPHQLKSSASWQTETTQPICATSTNSSPPPMATAT